MITPPEYIPFSYLAQHALEIAHSELDIYFDRFFQHEGNFILYRPLDILSSWLLEFCDLELFLTNGVTISRVDARILNRYRFNGFSQLFDLAKVPGEILKSFSIAGKTMSSDFEESERDKVRSMLKKVYVSASPLMFVNTVDFSIDLALYNYVSANLPPDESSDLAEAHIISATLAPFKGYSLCTSKSYFDSSWLQFWNGRGLAELARFHSPFDEGNEESTNIGRPSIGPELLGVYFSIYPNGHSIESWSDVHKAMMKRYPRPFHIDTLKRHLGKK